MLRVCMIVVLLIALPVVAQNATPDVSALTAVRVLELDMAAGLAATGAQISPDGTTFIHVHGSDFCHYSLLGPEIACWDMSEQGVIDEGGVPVDPDSLRWSPDGQYVAFAIEPWRLLIDSDIFVLALESGQFANLTEDDYDRGFSPGREVPDGVTVDTAPAWTPDGRLTFIRHSAALDETAPALWEVSPAGGEPQKIADLLTAPEEFSYVPSAEWSPDGSQLAYILESRRSLDAGVWLYDAQSGEIAMLAGRPREIDVFNHASYSPDGRALLLLTGNRDQARFSPRAFMELGSGYFIVDVESGKATPLAADGAVTSAGWLPEGGLAYTGQDGERRGEGGLYVTADPTVAGRRVLDFTQGGSRPVTFFAPTGRQIAPLFIHPDGLLMLATSELTMLVVRIRNG